MWSGIKQLALPLCLLAALAMAALINLQLKGTPMVRSSPRYPIYTLGDADDARRLAQGERIVKLGPCLFGLYSGTLAFDSLQDAQDYLGARGLNKQQWQIFRLSGDFRLDVSDGLSNKTLLLQPLVP